MPLWSFSTLALCPVGVRLASASALGRCAETTKLCPLGPRDEPPVAVA